MNQFCRQQATQRENEKQDDEYDIVHDIVCGVPLGSQLHQFTVTQIERVFHRHGIVHTHPTKSNDTNCSVYNACRHEHSTKKHLSLHKGTHRDPREPQGGKET